MDRQDEIKIKHEVAEELKKRAKWEGVTLSHYIETLMKKCPFPFGG